METSNDHVSTLYTLVQLALRDLISGGEAESLLGGVKHLSPALLDKISDSAAALGVAFSELSIRDLILPGDVKITLSESWRAKKHSLAELEAARGKAAATRTLANAANLYDKNPALLQVRYLEVLETAAAGMGHTFVIGTENAKALTLTK
jgi:regulator of protease activity HflC (stomatin/prohibitin superfamily)